MLTATDELLLTSGQAIKKKAAAPAPIIRERIFGLPVDPDVLFADDHNAYCRRIEKRQRQLIIKLSFLKSFLHPGEKVLLITTAYSPLRLAEQILTAGLFLDLERAIIVFTSFRILHAPVGQNYRYRQSLAQIRYRDIRAIKLQRGALQIDYKSGTIEKFKAVAFAERRKIKQLIPALPLTMEVLSPSGRTHLCPHCTRTLIKPVPRCPRCGLAFKKAGLALAGTLLNPGGGYLYLLHRRPAALFSLAEATAGCAGTWLFWHQGVAALASSPVWLVLTAMALLRGLAWLHLAHLVREFVPCQPRKCFGLQTARLLQFLRRRPHGAKQPV
ncbi:MAG: hypothetical protein JJV98_07840 [Desulfosarcina sp.]|nr:hypothetical protein [Desulfobacterales bacterium]